MYNDVTYPDARNFGLNSHRKDYFRIFLVVTTMAKILARVKV